MKTSYERLNAAVVRIVAYMEGKNYRLFRGAGELNIVYVEGLSPDGTPNSDLADGWNDLRLLIAFEAGRPVAVHAAVCTTEPGRSATFSSVARARGGVARIAFGQYTAWRMGYHRQSRLLDTHPALVQCAPVLVYRDKNRDGLRTGDALQEARGINQHATTPGYKGGVVGRWSEGCLVGKWFSEHLDFLEILRTDPRYLKDRNFVFTTSVLPGDKI